MPKKLAMARITAPPALNGNIELVFFLVPGDSPPKTMLPKGVEDVVLVVAVVGKVGAVEVVLEVPETGVDAAYTAKWVWNTNTMNKPKATSNFLHILESISLSIKQPVSKTIIDT